MIHRVDAVQQMLGTHVPVDQQILMYEGRRLEPQHVLSVYGLPAAAAVVRGVGLAGKGGFPMA